MPTNRVFLSGNIAQDPEFRFLPSGTPYLRFFLVVPRSREQMPSKDVIQKVDLIRVVEYGRRAEVDRYYLRAGAEVSIEGWLQSRPYVDKKTRRRRNQKEVNVVNVTHGRGCDFKRGDEQLLVIEGPDHQRFEIPDYIQQMLESEVVE